MGRVLRKNRRLSVSDLLAILGFKPSEQPAMTPAEWLRYYMGKPLAAPTPRPKRTRGWHQPKRSSRKGPCYSKLNRKGKLGPKHFKKLGTNAAFQRAVA